MHINKLNSTTCIINVSHTSLECKRWTLVAASTRVKSATSPCFRSMRQLCVVSNLICKLPLPISLQWGEFLSVPIHSAFSVYARSFSHGIFIRLVKWERPCTFSIIVEFGWPSVSEWATVPGQACRVQVSSIVKSLHVAPALFELF